MMAELGPEGMEEFQDRIDELGEYLYTTLLNSVNEAANTVDLNSIGKNLTTELSKGLSDVQVDKILTQKLLKDTKVQKVMSDIQKKVVDSVGKIEFKINNIQLPTKPLFVDVKANTFDTSGLPNDISIPLSYDTSLLESQLDEIKKVKGTIAYTPSLSTDLKERELTGNINYTAIVTKPLTEDELNKTATINYNTKLVKQLEVDNIDRVVNYEGRITKKPSKDELLLNGKVNYVGTVLKPKVDLLSGKVNYSVGNIAKPTIKPLEGIVNYTGKLVESPVIKDITANVNYQNNLPDQPEINDIEKTVKFNIQDIQTPKVEDIERNIKFNVQDIQTPKVEDINASVNYTLGNVPDQPKIDNIEKSIKFNVEQPTIPNIDNIERNIKYNVQDIQTPKVEDIGANINYNVNQPLLPEIDNLTASITYQNNLPEQPKIENIERSVNYVGKLTSTPQIVDLSGKVNYSTGKIVEPKVSEYTPLIGKINYSIGNIAKPDIGKYSPLLGKINYSTGDIAKPLINPLEGTVNYIGKLSSELRVDDLKGLIDYKGQITEPKVNDLKGVINYEGQITKPVVTPLKGIITYVGQIVKPLIEQLKGIINYQGRVDEPKVDPLKGLINYIGNITEPNVDPLSGKVNYIGKVVEPKVSNLEGTVVYKSLVKEPNNIKEITSTINYVANLTQPLSKNLLVKEGELNYIARVAKPLSKDKLLINGTINYIGKLKSELKVDELEGVIYYKSELAEPLDTNLLVDYGTVNFESKLVKELPSKSLQQKGVINYISKIVKINKTDYTPLTGVINYVIGNIEKPKQSEYTPLSGIINYESKLLSDIKVEDIKANVLYQNKLPLDKPVVEDLNGVIQYKGVIDKPTIPLLEGVVTYVGKLIEPLINELSGIIVYEGKINNPSTISPLEGVIDYTSNVTKPDISKYSPLSGKIDYEGEIVYENILPQAPKVPPIKSSIIYETQPVLQAEQVINAILKITNIESVVKSIKSKVIDIAARISSIDTKEAESKLPILKMIASIEDVITSNIKPQYVTLVPDTTVLTELPDVDITAKIAKLNTDLLNSSLANIKPFVLPINTGTTTGTVSNITSTLTSGMEDASNAAKTFFNLITEANKKSSITLDLFNKIKASGEAFAATNKANASQVNDIIKALEEKVKTKTVKAKLSASIAEVDTKKLDKLIEKITPIELSSVLNIDESQLEKLKNDFIVVDAILQVVDKTELDKLQSVVMPLQATASATQSIQPTTTPQLPEDVSTVSGSANDGAVASIREAVQAQKEGESVVERLLKAGNITQTQADNILAAYEARVKAARDEFSTNADIVSMYNNYNDTTTAIRKQQEVLGKLQNRSLRSVELGLNVNKQLAKLGKEEVERTAKKIGLNVKDYKNTLDLKNAIRHRIIQAQHENELKENLISAQDDYNRAIRQANADSLVKQVTAQLGLTEATTSELAYQLMLQGPLTEQQKKNLQAQDKALRHKKEQVELDEHIAKYQKEINEETEKYARGWEKIKATTKAIFTNPALAKGIIAASAIQGVHKLTHAMHEFKEVGMGAGEAVSATFRSLSIESVLGLSKSADVTKTIAQEFGNLNALTNDQINSVGKLAYNNGLAGQEATTLVMAMGRMPGMTRETATNSEAMFKSIGKAKGVIPGQIMKEMAKNTANMALYSKGGAQGFANAAASAKKMGIELNSILSAAEKTLDFESSLTAQMEASAMIGKEINFDKLRQAALSGDANAVMAEQQRIMQNVGGLDKMNLLQKKALASAMGLSVEEMQKMTDEANFQNKYFGEQAGITAKILGNVLKYGEAGMNAVTQFGPLIASVISLALQTKMLTALKVQDTIVTNVNTNANKLSNAQMVVYRQQRALGATATQAMAAARAVDTGATTSNTLATRISTIATGTWNLVKKATIGLLRISGVLWLGDKLAKLASAAATGISTAAEATGNVVRGAWIALTNSKILADSRARLATIASTVATGANNLVVGIGNGIKRVAIALLGAERVAMIASTLAKWAGVGANNALATSSAPAAAGTRSLSTALTSLAAAKGAVPVILAIGAAILMIGIGVAAAAYGMAQLVGSFKDLSGGEIAGALVAMVVVMGGFVVMVALLGKVAAIAALPILALGAAFLLIGAGIALAAFGMSKLVESFKGLSPEQSMAAAMSIQAMSLAFIALAAALVIVALSSKAAAGPMLALGFAVTLIGAGIALAAMGIGKGIEMMGTGLTAAATGVGILLSQTKAIQPTIDMLELLSKSLKNVADNLAAVATAGLIALPVLTMAKSLISKEDIQPAVVKQQSPQVNIQSTQQQKTTSVVSSDNTTKQDAASQKAQADVASLINKVDALINAITKKEVVLKLDSNVLTKAVLFNMPTGNRINNSNQ